MSASPASYAQLGLLPGADRAAVDRAYRALMKRHHPDLGGDPARAASINHAYADITRPASPGAAPSPTDRAAALYQRHQILRRAGAARGPEKRSRWSWLLALAGAIGIVVWVERDPLTDLAWDLQWRYFPPGRPVMSSDDDEPAAASAVNRVPLGTSPLSGNIIISAENAARRILKSGGIGAAADASQRCYLRFHAAPSLGGYDLCVAFDDAVLLIGGYGVADRGGFSAGAVTARQLAAARTLDRDYESIETRLDRIRLAMMHRLEAPPEPAMERPARG
ncbi:MAG: J domain-containing protein [Sphingomicrobium sp.]